MVQAADEEEQFVYLLRDRAGVPVYVGRGQKSTRPLAHFGSRAHNTDLTEEILRGAVSVEIAGSFGDAQTAAIVEAALISAFRLTPPIRGRLKNKDPGASAGRFRPYGVPTKFLDRASQSQLTEADLLAVAQGRPVIAVLLTKKLLRDGRRTFDMALGASDRDLTMQMDRWWPIGRELRQRWEADPASGPALLVGMSGSPHHRVIVGALEIDRNRAVSEASSNSSSRFRIPIQHAIGLDFGELRGRYVNVGKMQQSGIKIIESPQT